jgi:hypothetical protein
MHYLCIVFFMVLDLRLTMKIVVVVRQPFFFAFNRPFLLPYRLSISLIEAQIKGIITYINKKNA